MNNVRLVVLALWLGASLIPGVSSLRAADTPAAQIAQAADAFVRTLNAAQRQGVQFALDDAQQRTRWSNLPVSMAKHGGLRMGDLTEEQRAAAMRLLRAALSERGYEKIVGIVRSRVSKPAAATAPAPM